MTCNKGSGAPILGTVHISEVNGARKVKSDKQVAMNSDPMQKYFSLGVSGGQLPQLKFFQTSGIV